jgi:hypothetical protein
MRFIIISAILFIVGVISPAFSAGQEKAIVGWLEKVHISPENLPVRAKLDTGAKTSSITALNMVEFYRSEELWVRFDVINKKRKRITLEKKVKRVAQIKRHGAHSQRRYVVQLLICLGSLLKEAEFTLVDRSEFNYPVLLGRNFLSGVFVVDPSAKFTAKSQCGGDIQR